MAIDPHNLPQEADALRQMVLELLQLVEDKDRLLERVQRQLQQLLRQRYGPKRERIDENQLFLYAAQIVAAGQAGAAAPTTADSAAEETPAASASQAQRRGHGRKPLPASLERKRVVFDLEESQRQCPQCQTAMGARAPEVL
jgi:transposase